MTVLGLRCDDSHQLKVTQLRAGVVTLASPRAPIVLRVKLSFIQIQIQVQVIDIELAR